MYIYGLIMRGSPTPISKIMPEMSGIAAGLDQLLSMAVLLRLGDDSSALFELAYRTLMHEGVGTSNAD
jgi:hypothetical protein